MAKKTYLLDTSVYLTNADSIYSYANNDIIIPLKVLEEIDKHKKRQDGVGSNARKIIRTLDSLREKGNLHKGVRLARGKGIISVKRCDSSILPEDLSANIPDHLIIATALTELQTNPSRKVVVVTRDINMRVICDSLGLQCEDFVNHQVVKDTDSIFNGFRTCLVDDQTVDQFYDGEDIYIDALPENTKLYPNQYVMLVSSSSEKKTAIARYINDIVPLRRVQAYKKGVWGVRARNKEQQFALDLLMDPSVQIVTLIGKAGSGKTLCAIAAGIEQIMQNPMSKSEPVYSRMIVSRPVQPLGKDIGFLPGTLEEKMKPWLMPIQDNLQYLMSDKTTLEMYMNTGQIEIEALTYIRGRSIANAFIVIDEAQNLTNHELKTIITRVGEGTKIILTGDVEQIDNAYIDETTNGLTHAVEKFKEFDISGHVSLHKGERSKVATLAAKIL
jgi:PhoH-like ATPase